MAENKKQPKKKTDKKKLFIRIVCFVLALSLVISTVYMLFAYLAQYLAK